MQCILGNTSTIDVLQAKRGVTETAKGDKLLARTKWQNLKEVFGSDFDFWWLIPTDVPKFLVVEREYDWLIILTNGRWSNWIFEPELLNHSKLRYYRTEHSRVRPGDFLRRVRDKRRHSWTEPPCRASAQLAWSSQWVECGNGEPHQSGKAKYAASRRTDQRQLLGNKKAGYCEAQHHLFDYKSKASYHAE